MLEQEGVKQYSVISPNPTERTATAYRFEVAVPAAGAKTITVKQERIITQQTSVNNAPNDFLLAAIQNKQLSTSGRRQLQAIIDLKNQIADAMAAQESEKKSLQDLTDEQTRLRQNINSLNQVKGQEEQVRQYSSQLASNEAAMAKLRDQRDASAQRRLTLEDQLRQAIAALDF